MGLGARAGRGMTSLDELLGGDLSKVAWNTSHRVTIDPGSVADIFQHFHSVLRASLIYNHPYLLVTKGASILDSDNLTAGKGASILDSDNLSASKASSIADNDNLSDTKLQSILDNDNLAIQKGQEIADAMSKPSKIGTGGRRGIIADDWADNKLTSRDRAAVIDTPFDLIYQNFRPEWTEDIAGGTVTDGRLHWDEASDGDWRILCTPVQTEGTWELDFQYTTMGNDYDNLQLIPVWENADNDWNMLIQDDAGDSFNLNKDDGGTRTNVISTTWVCDTASHTVKVTRNAPDSWEIFLDGASEGTATDSYWPTENNTGIYFKSSAGGSVIEADNLKVY